MKQIINPTLRQPKIAGISPVWNEDCKLLILGSITSIDGMKKGFYYASERNQLWQLVDISLGLNSKSENSFMFLKNLLKENYINFANNKIDFDMFQANKIAVQNQFSKKLLENHIAICDVFEECFFNNNSSLDQDIMLNSTNYPCKNNKDAIEYILKNSRISTVLVNSRFVETEFNKMNIGKRLQVCYVESPSPRKGKIDKKIESWQKSIQHGLSL